LVTVDLDKTMRMVPDCRLTKMLSGVRVWIEKPLSCKSWMAFARLLIINASFFESKLSRSIYFSMASTLSAMRQESSS
jgi:hypothetical protein